MSTYLQGVTDTGFNSVNFSPNLPYLMNALQKVTARYEKNYDEMSQGYSSILNAEMYNNKQSGKRDQYLNEIKDKLKTISTTDLSVQSNIDSANSLYTPFWEDKTMLSHIADTKARKNQIAEQEKIKKEHPDYDNTTPNTVMNYYINKIKTAEDPDIINQTPLISAVGLKNNAKDFQEWIKKNDWKQDITVAQNGNLYRQVNGTGALVSYSELFKTFIGNSAQDQYNMYGEYYKINGIQEIQANNKLKGIDLSDEDAIKMIPDFYVGKQLENLNLQKKALINDLLAVNENSILNAKDPIKIADDKTRAIDIDKQLTEINKKYNLLQTKGGANENDKKEYNDMISSIQLNPTSFFSNIAYNTDVEKAAKMAASNQSLTITKDEGAYAEAKLKEEVRQFAINTALKEQELAISAAKNAESSNKKGVETVDENGVSVPVYDSVTPTITPGQSNNLIVDAVTGFQKMNSDLVNSGINSMIEVLQSTTSDVFKDILTAQEGSALGKAYKQNQYDDPMYTTAVGKIKQGLINKGASKKEIDKINGPVQLILKLEEYYVGEVNKHIAQKEINIKNNKPDPVLDATIIKEYSDYTVFQTAKEKMDNAYAHNDAFNKKINQKIKKNPKYYEKISIVKKDGTAELITAQGLSEYFSNLPENKSEKKEKINLPVNLAQQYINGNLKVIPRIFKVKDSPNFNQNPLVSKGIPSTSQGYKNKYYSFIVDPETGIEYNVTPLVVKYGKPEVLAANLKKTFTTDKSLIPKDVLKTILDSTGEMGRTMTWTSSTKNDKDYADKLANDIGQNLNSYMIQTGDAFNIITADDKNLAESLNSDIIPEIRSNPAKGLTAVKYNPIGSRDPSKRNITLVYDTETIIGKDAKNKEKYKNKDGTNWDGSITFEVKSDAQIPGLPTAEGGSYYDLQLSVNPKGIIQTKVDEQFGLKYEVYKDQDGQIKFKVGYQTILESVNDKGEKVLSYIWKDGTDPSGSTNYSESGGFKFLPKHKTIEETIEELRQLAITVRQQFDTKLQKTYPNVAPVPIADQTFIDEANKTISEISKKYNK